MDKHNPLDDLPTIKEMYPNHPDSHDKRIERMANAMEEAGWKWLHARHLGSLDWCDIPMRVLARAAEAAR